MKRVPVTTATGVFSLLFTTNVKNADITTCRITDNKTSKIVAKSEVIRYAKDSYDLSKAHAFSLLKALDGSSFDYKAKTDFVLALKTINY